MATPSRFTKIGLADRKSATTQTDPFIQQFVAKLPIVASTAEQNTTITLPSKAQELSVSVNIITAEVTGTTKTVDIGIVGNPDILIDDADVSNAGFVGKTGGAGESATPVDLSGATITYALGSNDFAELEAEVVVTVIGAE